MPLMRTRRRPERLWVALGGDPPLFLPFDIELRAADLLLVTGAWDRVEAVYRKYLGLLPAGGREREAARVHGLFGMFCEARGDHDEALRHDGLAIAICERIGDEPGLAYALGNAGAAHLELSRFGEARDCFERQRALCQRLGDAAGLARALGNLGLVCQDTGDHRAARGFFGQQTAICERLGDKRGLARAHGNDGLLFWQQDDYPRARAKLELTLQLCREVGDARMLAITIGNLGLIQGETGDLEGAIDSYRQQLALALRLGERTMVPLARENMANELIKLGRFAEAAPLLDLAADGHRELDDAYGEARVLRLRADLHKARREHGDADREMREAVGLLRPLGIEHDLADFLLNWAEIAHELGRSDEALALLDEACTRYRAQGRAAHLQLAELVKCRASFAAARTGDARAAAAEALQDLLKDSTDPGFLAQVHFERYRMLRALGKPWHDSRETALGLYRTLYSQAPKHAYRQRIDELSSMQ